MAYSQDYIKRMIEQFGAFLLGIKRQIAGEHYEAAQAEIDEAYKALFGMDSDFVFDAPDDYLVLMTNLNSGGDANKSLLLADLLDAEAKIDELRGDYERSDARYLKAINVLTRSALQLTHKPCAEHIERIDGFVDKLQDVLLPIATKGYLFQVYERIGRYAEAEDMLFDMLDTANDEEEITIGESGVAFYQRLLQLNDYDLDTGGLPRAEVEEGLRELTE